MDLARPICGVGPARCRVDDVGCLSFVDIADDEAFADLLLI
jgi:hypothetical protein